MRDFRPSRQEQEKLKIKKSRTVGFQSSLKNRLSIKNKNQEISPHSKPSSQVVRQSLLVKRREIPAERRKKTPTTKREKRSYSWFFNLSFFVVILGLLFLTFFAIRERWFKQKTNNDSQKILLKRDRQPLALLYLSAKNQQVVLVNLSSDLEQQILTEEFFSSTFSMPADELDQDSSPSEEINNRLNYTPVHEKFIYSLLLDQLLDQVLEYPNTDLSRNTIENFLIQQNGQYSFIKNPKTKWLEIDGLAQANTEQVLDENLDNFHCTVAIINTSEEPGLAGSLADWLSKSAFLVVGRNSNPDRLESSKLVANPLSHDCQKESQRLRNFLGVDQANYSQQLAIEQRADLIVFLGEDLAVFSRQLREIIKARQSELLDE